MIDIDFDKEKSLCALDTSIRKAKTELVKKQIKCGGICAATFGIGIGLFGYAKISGNQGTLKDVFTGLGYFLTAIGGVSWYSYSTDKAQPGISASRIKIFKLNALKKELVRHIKNPDENPTEAFVMHMKENNAWMENKNVHILKPLSQTENTMHVTCNI